MVWTWERIVELNKLICDVSGQPHAVREAVHSSIPEKDLPAWIANNHPFVEGNKRTGACIAICLALKDV